ncbi:MAG: hypothetical protein K2Y23_14080 [Cyanobacteria bacterium]|nr:hypothetical protein [Cyanobacteriota bacterium]
MLTTRIPDYLMEGTVMMNTVVGSAIGGLVAGAVALGAAAAMRPSPAPAYGPDLGANGAYAMTVANTAPMNTSFGNTAAALQCQPYEEAVLRRALVNGREVTDLTCITRNNAGYPPQAMYAPQAYAQPVGYQQPVYRDDIVTRPVVRTRSVTPARQRASAAERENRRSWGKTAMIIGGGTGAGAGVGGLIGGKKGALIGAAVGGGAATIYESTKR